MCLKCYKYSKNISCSKINSHPPLEAVVLVLPIPDMLNFTYGHELVVLLAAISRVCYDFAAVDAELVTEGLQKGDERAVVSGSPVQVLKIFWARPCKIRNI